MTGDCKAQPLTPDRALTLFKTYEDKGWAVKQQMLTSVAWLTPFIFGLIAFSITDHIDDPTSTTPSVAGWTAFFLSCFMAILTLISLWHANSDYVRSHKILDHATKKQLLPPAIFDAILGNKEKCQFVHWISTQYNHVMGWINMQHIGWQFIIILLFTFLLVHTSYCVTLKVAPSATGEVLDTPGNGLACILCSASLADLVFPAAL